MHKMVLYGPNHCHHGPPTFKSDTTPCSAHNDGIGINNINDVHALIANGLQHPVLKEAANVLLMTMNENSNNSNSINNNIMTSSAVQPPSSQQQPSSSNNNAMLSSASLLNDNFFNALSNNNNIHTNCTLPISIQTQQQKQLVIDSDLGKGRDVSYRLVCFYILLDP